MKLIVNRGELLAICRHATRIASEASPVEELRGVLLEADETEQVLTVTATNFELSLRCRIGADVREAGAWVVNAKMLTGMLGLLPGEKIALYGMSNGTMQMAGGACRYAVGVLPGRGYPKTEIPFPEDTVQVSGIPSLAKRTVFAVSENEEQPVMRCVNLVFSENGLRAVGSDGSRVMSVKGEAKSAGTISLLVPAKSITALAGMVSDQEVLSVGTTGQSVVFMRENFIFSARLMAGTYINADALLQSVKASFTVLTDGEALWRALDAVITVADESGNVCLYFEGGRIKLQCDCVDGSVRGELEVIPLTGKPSGCYYYPAKKLAECLRVLGGTLQLQVAQNGLLLLDTEQATCLQSAVRAPTAQKAEKKMSAKAA